MDGDDHEPDAAAEAFEGVRAELARQGGEIALLRRAIEGIAAHRDNQPEQPDYSETLGWMVNALKVNLQRIDVVAQAAENGVAARQVADRIVAAGADSRDHDRRMIASAGTELKEATRALHGAVASARRADEQNGWLMWATIGGTLLGMLLWAALAGPIARSMPASWLWPERMAARALDRPMWEAGAELMQASSLDAYASVVAGDKLVIANHDALRGCQKQAAKAHEAVRCTIRVGAE